MYYIVETKEQLGQLEGGERCFIDIITLSEDAHPSLTTPSVIYYNNFKKGYILPIASIRRLDIVPEGGCIVRWFSVSPCAGDDQCRLGLSAIHFLIIIEFQQNRFISFGLCLFGKIFGDFLGRSTLTAIQDMDGFPGCRIRCGLFSLWDVLKCPGKHAGQIAVQPCPLFVRKRGLSRYIGYADGRSGSEGWCCHILFERLTAHAL